jgi:hypothetical protein
MELPNVVTTFIDQQSGVTYKVIAYRKLTRQEVLSTIRGYSMLCEKPPQRGAVVTIPSPIT